MDTKELEPEVVEVFEHIDSGKNFVLSGGAGSGKTYSLISIINEIFTRNSNASIACITYTNAAADEIENRVTGVNKGLRVSTIHDFLWDNISMFQSALKETLVALANDPNSPIASPSEEPLPNDYFSTNIQYAEYAKLALGKISHDEVLVVANAMFARYNKLCDILIDKYQYIFIDEYQDTSKYVVQIFLEHLKKSKKSNIIGFFGDSMQSIYDDSIENLNSYINDGTIQEVRKLQNRRNPACVIELANKIRRQHNTNGLIQDVAKDTAHPGTIHFLYGDIKDYNSIKSHDVFSQWDFNDTENTKELRLTHKLIASEAQFDTLMAIYNDDPIIDFKGKFFEFMKQEGRDINEHEKFDDTVRSNIDWKYGPRARPAENRGQQYIDVFLTNEGNKVLYDFIKDKTCGEVKKIFFNKDQLMDDKNEDNNKKSLPSLRDPIVKHLLNIYEVIMLYENGKYNEFIRRTSFKIKTVNDKHTIKEKMEKLQALASSGNIEQVVACAHDEGICLQGDKFNDFIGKNDYLYFRLKKVKYAECKKLYEYIEGYTPLSTQHKVKGAEYDNILVILDNGKWSKYNFSHLFKAASNPTPSVLARTEKLFYVCCTRAKKNLVVVQSTRDEEILKTAFDWFGKTNCHCIE